GLGDVYKRQHIPREGAGQLALVGPPNAGKSSLLAALTHAHPEIAEYPFTTRAPHPGLMPFEDVQVQLIDTPPVAEPFDPLVVTVARNADGTLLVLDLSAPEAIEHVDLLRRFLDRARIIPRGRPVPEELAISGRVQPVLIAFNKADLGVDEEMARLAREALGSDLPDRRISASHGGGLEDLRAALFATLDVLRVYTKEPGKKPDLGRPFVLRRGATVLDLATIIHKDVGASFRFARVWGSAKFEGQQVERDHVLRDRDVVEIHAAG
ncbi:MAG: TGS domain-containing protein, partial [Candidatus Eisenbacteria bacterium]|nr:TGS domain-containing protein [Candidatus Eisenbacteria bacterium]